MITAPKIEGMTASLTILGFHGFVHSGGGDCSDLFEHPSAPFQVILYNEGNWEILNKGFEQPRCRGDNAQELNRRLVLFLG